MIFHAVEFIGSFIDGQKGIVQVTGRQIAIVSQLKVQ
jgi:type III secretory pathway component EscT